MGTPDASNLPDKRQKTQTELEMEAGRKANERYAGLRTAPAKKTNGVTGPVSAVGPTDNPGGSGPQTTPVAQQAQVEHQREQQGGSNAGQAKQSGTRSTDEIASFMTRVVPWPQDGEPGVINLHWTSPKGPGMRGRAYTKVEDFLGMAQWGATKPVVMKDIYFCLSSQSAVGPTYNGHASALRNKKNVVALKAIWLDIDVKADNGYATLVEAREALEQFLVVAKLPPPSASVFSGGGIHVYWISDRPLSAAEWQLYAERLESLARLHQLKCDYGVTSDSARILRVPGTFNYKTDPPKPVRLAGLGRDYDFSTALAHICSVEVTAAVTTEPPFGLTSFPKKPSDGINTCDDTPLDYAEVFKGCPHFQDAFKTHGAGYPQGLWMLDVLASTFFQDGDRVAHTLSKGYATYTKEETDKLIARKRTEREQKELGWPSCKAFEAAGCKQCASCRHHGKIKSPLNLATRTARPVQKSAAGQTKNSETNPVAALMRLRDQGADLKTLLTAMNETYAVVRYGNEILVASIIGDDIIFMREQHFHRMFANLVVYAKPIEVRLREIKNIIERVVNDIISMTYEEFSEKFADLVIKQDPLKVSRSWFGWKDRRQYLRCGVVFQPGGPLEIPNDMVNLWRGFGIEPKQGDWSLMRNHILKVVCGGQQKHFDYLIKWMACAVQRPNEPIGVAVAFRGAQGAGKGVVARTFGKIFGKHFAHIANGDQLTGRFNASLATSCAIFLDEALWAGDKKGEGVLKALITEPRLQLEAKFRDPIMVDNRLRIMVASNNDWMVPAGVGDRRWFVLDVANTYAGTAHKAYWDVLYAEIENGGAAAMFFDLLAMNLSGFNVRAVPPTAAKAQQQSHSLNGTEAWLHHILQEGEIGSERWQKNGLEVSKYRAYDQYEDFSKRQRDYRPETKSVWSRKIGKALRHCLTETRSGGIRSFQFKPLADCRRQFAKHIVAPNIEWEP